ncbi:hypothetical protein [Microbulbifer aggregans]|uniref:hypothetical protein n=1 Tax=Microbulbifer aggregans TaxID=1769779 RepID=UPI001CFE06AC|nr:hypothetical protein [Microbulbifer aggregans]
MKKNIGKIVTLTGLSVALTACGSLSANEQEVPALITGATPEARAELQRALVEANNGAPVTIADSAFRESSLMILEQGRLADSSQRLLSGRDLGKPKSFTLVSRGGDCWLVRNEDGQRWHLESIKCIPEK